MVFLSKELASEDQCFLPYGNAVMNEGNIMEFYYEEIVMKKFVVISFDNDRIMHIT